jgi:hypothetical protein
MPCDNSMNNSFHRKIYLYIMFCIVANTMHIMQHLSTLYSCRMMVCINFPRRGRIRFGSTKNIEIRSAIEVVRHSFFPDGICPPIECVCVHRRSLNKKHIKLPSIITTVNSDGRRSCTLCGPCPRITTLLSVFPD